jgi:hypothetical protein
MLLYDHKPPGEADPETGADLGHAAAAKDFT